VETFFEPFAGRDDNEILTSLINSTVKVITPQRIKHVHSINSVATWAIRTWRSCWINSTLSFSFCAFSDRVLHVSFQICYPSFCRGKVSEEDSITWQMLSCLRYTWLTLKSELLLLLLVEECGVVLLLGCGRTWGFGKAILAVEAVLSGDVSSW
jgi:hypothetical protein